MKKIQNGRGSAFEALKFAKTEEGKKALEWCNKKVEELKKDPKYKHIFS